MVDARAVTDWATSEPALPMALTTSPTAAPRASPKAAKGSVSAVSGALAVLMGLTGTVTVSGAEPALLLAVTAKLSWVAEVGAPGLAAAARASRVGV